MGSVYPVAGKRYGERLMCEYLDILIPDSPAFDNVRYKWLVNPKTNQPLEIDRYYPKLKVGFEFQGEQHFRQVEGMGDYKQIVYLDKLKKKLCKEQGVLLIHVKPIDLQAATMRKFAKKVSETVGVRKYRYDAKSFDVTKLHKLDCAATDYRQFLMERYPDSVGVYPRKTHS